MTDWHLPTGYRFTGVHSGIRSDRNRLDLALVVSNVPAAAAGVFTRNRVVAAPVQVCRERLPGAAVRGIVICSGNANACTGERGLRDARRMTEVAAANLDCRPEQVLVCSTGVIGVHLPMPVVETGIAQAARQLGDSADDLTRAARAILTTDTQIKVSTRSLAVGERTVHVAGFAKGAAMIGPNMATLLAFVLTDAAVAPADLSELAIEAADQTFNCISVEGHTSTNDSLIVMANGQAPVLRGESLERFRAAVIAVCADLARAIAADAEGATHLVRIEVDGLRSDGEARKVAKTVAESALVKTALFGADPNWGRIVSAAGYAGVEFVETQLSLWLGDTLLYDRGTPQPFDAKAVAAWMKGRRELLLRLRFTLGEGRCTFWTSDLTYDYVRLNAEYTT